MKSSVLIVGNGTSLLDKERGLEIDRYDKVVRFNNYDTRKFKSYVGERTDIWFNVVDFANKENEWRMREKYEKIFIHSWQPDELKDSLFLSFRDFYKTKLDKENLVEKLPHSIMSELCLYHGDFSYRFFSTGLLAIWLLLKMHKSVDIVGFDWWHREDHHYNDKAARGSLHKPSEEKKIIDKLNKEGKVFFLD